MSTPPAVRAGDSAAGALDEAGRAELATLTAGASAVLPEGALAERLALARAQGRPLRVKLGIDPSGSDLTLGHAVVLRKLRQFQDAGHLAVLIVGDFTGQVGDPTGASVVRPALSVEATAANAATYFDQVMRVLDPERVEVRHNADWLAPMTMTDVIREARELTVARLLERDDFATRYAEGRPISLVEFLYPLLQGYDSVAVEADVELGGTDQTYNLLVGRDLQRAHGQPQQVVLTMPLLEGLDGVKKMSKSLGNYVAITEAPEQQFGKLMSLPDRLVGRYAQLCTSLSGAEVAELDRAAGAGGPAAATAKRVMARAVVATYYDAAAATAAEGHFDTVFREHAVPADLPVAGLPAGDPVHLPALLVEVGLAGSRTDGRRRVDEGAVRVDGVPLAAGRYDLNRADLAGRVLAVGRRRMVRLAD
ncbi:MAG: tyrosine--tRNA ligase [Mycobacteriales bacterium]